MKQQKMRLVGKISERFEIVIIYVVSLEVIFTPDTVTDELISNIIHTQTLRLKKTQHVSSLNINVRQTNLFYTLDTKHTGLYQSNTLLIQFLLIHTCGRHNHWYLQRLFKFQVSNKVLMLATIKAPMCP